MITWINLSCRWKRGALVAAVAFLALLAVGLTHFWPNSNHRAPQTPEKKDVRSFHFTRQSRSNDPGAVSSYSKGAYEQWYYLAAGKDVPLWMRMQRWDAQEQQKLCSWLQNDQGNYYYHCGENRVYVNNYRLWLSSFRTRRFPTDSPELTAILDEIEGKEPQIQDRRDSATQLLIDTLDQRFVDVGPYTTVYRYNTLTNKDFEPYWSPETEVIDNRDALHRQGWGYFEISGVIDGEPIHGAGQMPFVSSACTDHPPRIEITFPAGLQREDDGGQTSGVGQTEALLPVSGQNLFVGLARPWSGLHCIDTLRRDAAERGLRFVTFPFENRSKAWVTIREAGTVSGGRVTYRLDMEQDLIETITLAICENGEMQTRGTLTFSYATQSPFAARGPADAVAVASNVASPADGGSAWWLLELANGHWQKDDRISKRNGR